MPPQCESAGTIIGNIAKSLHGVQSFVLSFFILTYLLNRPCVYCSILLLILFASSCYWSDRCFFDLNSNWFEPRSTPSESADQARNCAWSTGTEEDSLVLAAFNETAIALGSAAAGELRRRITTKPDWTGVGWQWAKGWIISREWRVPCLDVNIRL